MRDTGPPSGIVGEVADTTVYQVLVNHEEQYSIWPANKEIPLGWRAVGKTGPKDELLGYIKQVWTDMRPLSLRKKLETEERERLAPDQPSPQPDAEPESPPEP